MNLARVLHGKGSYILFAWVSEVSDLQPACPQHSLSELKISAQRRRNQSSPALAGVSAVITVCRLGQNT